MTRKRWLPLLVMLLLLRPLHAEPLPDLVAPDYLPAEPPQEQAPAEPESPAETPQEQAPEPESPAEPPQEQATAEPESPTEPPQEQAPAEPESPAEPPQEQAPAEDELPPLVAPAALDPEAIAQPEEAAEPEETVTDEPLLDPEAPPLPEEVPAAPQAEAAGSLLDPDAPPPPQTEAPGALPADAPPPPATEKSVWKPELTFGGEVRSRLGQDLVLDETLIIEKPGEEPLRRGTEDVVDWRSSVLFWSRLKLAASVQAYLELYAEYSVVGKRNEDGPTILFNGSDYRHDWRLRLWEAYFDFFKGPVDLRVGNQVISWGLLPVMSPSDRINPRNLNAYYWSDISGAREPILALRGTYHFSDMALELVWSPFFTESSLDLYGGDYSLFRYASAYGNMAYPISNLSYYVHGSKTIGSHPGLLTTESPGANPLNSQAGLRFSGNKGGIDFGLSYWFGFEELPTVHLDNEVRQLGEALLRNDTNLVLGHTQSLLDRLKAGEDPSSFMDSSYRRKHSVATEFGFSVWELGFKAEAAFLPDRTYYALDLNPVTHHTVAYAAGIDVIKTDLGKLSTFYLDIELFGSTLFGMRPGERLYFTSKANLGVFTSLRLAFLDNDLELELMNQTNFSSRDYVIVPRISYRPVQNLTLTLGVMILEAWAKEPAGYETFSSNTDRKDAPFGRFSDNDQVFLMLKYRY